MPADAGHAHAQHLWSFIESELRNVVALPAEAVAKIRQTVQTSRALFLFDGLDETRDERTRVRVLEAVGEFMRSAGSQCRFLLTARP